MNKLPFELESRKIIKKQDIRIERFKEPEVEELFVKGVINLDKPQKWLCRKVTRKLAGVLEIPKAGHAGTLDPNVTGVLPILLQRATKISIVLSVAGKIYEARMHLHEDVPEAKVLDALKKFVGKIKQMPPKLSAVKRQLREREIYFIEFKSKKGRDVDFVVGCEAGTYIRTLCVDIGKTLGVNAHLDQLRRLQSANLKFQNSVSFEQVVSAYREYMKTKNEKKIRKVILPIEKAVEHLNKIWIDDEVLVPLKNGSPVYLPGILAFHDSIKKGNFVAIMTTKNKLAGIGIAEMSSQEMKELNNGLAIKTDIVML